MAALLLHAGFVFAVLGSKLVLALVAIYHLFPGDATCPECNARTRPLLMDRGQRTLAALMFLGRVRRRWCPECLWESYVRRFPEPSPVGEVLRTGDPAGRHLNGGPTGMSF